MKVRMKVTVTHEPRVVPVKKETSKGVFRFGTQISKETGYYTLSGEAFDEEDRRDETIQVVEYYLKKEGKWEYLLARATEALSEKERILNEIHLD